MDIRTIKKKNSLTKIEGVRREFDGAAELEALEHLTIFVTGSYAREEASEHSDIDLFFVYNGELNQARDPSITTLRMLSKVVEVADRLEFPRFSNDGEYLKVLEKPEMLRSLGGRHDDYENHFTARMLMILESKCVYGNETYKSVLESILDAYFKDYPDHPKNFQPTFLVNDILRFWKTLCLNYENKRNQPEEDSARILAQKIKNLKLKFSRMLTCFGSICYIVSQENSSGANDLYKMMKMNPMERLKASIADAPELHELLARAENEYNWFLELTNVSEDELKLRFSDKNLRIDAFARADLFGESIYQITKTVAEKRGFLRYLIV